MMVLKEPVGPVAAFAPWNFPLGNPARKIGAPLAAGCTCILKPAEETPASALEVARALLDAGLPKGVLSVVFGVPAMVSEHLIGSPIIRAVHFTGSVPVGKQLTKLAADGMKRTTMELGGMARYWYSMTSIWSRCSTWRSQPSSATPVRSAFHRRGSMCITPCTANSLQASPGAPRHCGSATG